MYPRKAISMPAYLAAETNYSLKALAITRPIQSGRAGRRDYEARFDLTLHRSHLKAAVDHRPGQTVWTELASTPPEDDGGTVSRAALVTGCQMRFG